MAVSTYDARLKHKRDTETNWEQNNLVLLDGEVIFVDTTAGALRSKVGDGKTAYTDLPFSDQVIYEMLEKKADSSVAVNFSLSSSGWDATGNQTVMIAGLQADHNGVVSISQDFTSAQYGAVEKADLFVTGQMDGALTFTAKNIIPTISIPITLIVLG